jgi:organic hydroperoxide reductase OsmC/OhrA
MSTHTATVTWERGAQAFSDGKYSRGHVVSFDGGVSIPGSSAPDVVRPPLSLVEAADPEEMLAASAAMCHMLFFLDLARKAGFVIDSYTDTAEAQLGRDADGVVRITSVVLHPRIMWSGEVVPGAADVDLLHHKAHEACFIASSLRCPVTVD